MSCGRMYLLQRVSSVDTKLQEEHSNFCKEDDVCLVTAWRFPRSANVRKWLHGFSSGLLFPSGSLGHSSKAVRLFSQPDSLGESYCFEQLYSDHWHENLPRNAGRQQLRISDVFLSERFCHIQGRLAERMFLSCCSSKFINRFITSCRYKFLT